MNGFVSYCHADYQMFRSFRGHLRTIERAYNLRFWSDERINAGHLWNDQIMCAIAAADVFVLLVSPEFIASDYIWEKELPAIQQRRGRSDVLVLPVVLHRCLWQMVAAVLQALPTADGAVKPVAEWHPQRNGFDRAREQVGRSVEAYFGVGATTVQWGAP